uniref:Aryl hydrocarbon receptor nuclear translocator-like protein 2 isoform X2 n=1 Tax=Geotrypetes seraphini TaxID=260995 RepID=A0A6P8RRJ3_GEOSA|nr:aryl hydrocarbon receptor nuclear translocator-like protein 2 isoform X2 [Geotrypetes seraphini]
MSVSSVAIGTVIGGMDAEAQKNVAGADNQVIEGSQRVTSEVSSFESSPGKPTANTFGIEFCRKRKATDSDNQDTIVIDVDDLQNREPHSQIEKKRREKMNTLIEELSSMIPQCNPVDHKLDKLTVLRMAVQHLKSLQSNSGSYEEDGYKPSFLQDDELRHLILRAADGFLFVVGCDGGKILFVSESVSKILNYSQHDLIDQNLFDYLHPKDMAKVKEQLSSSDVSPCERLIDAKTGLQVNPKFQTGSVRLHAGARRSFFCRMKCNKIMVKEENPSSKKKDHRKYCTIHCTGYLKIWPVTEVKMEEESDAEKDSNNFSCLVAVGRLHPYIGPQNSIEIKIKPTEFITRYTVDGKFIYVDQRATVILGYLPQELLGTSCYEYFHHDDHTHLTDQHKAVLQSKEKIMTNSYKFKTKDGSFITLKSQWFSFINPWTKELEYIVSVNTVVAGHSEYKEDALVACGSQSSEDTSQRSFLCAPGMSSGTVLGAGSIGTKIANESLDLLRLHSSPSNSDLSPTSLLRKSVPLSGASNAVPKRELVQLSPSEIEELDTADQSLTSFQNHEHLRKKIECQQIFYIGPLDSGKPVLKSTYKC